ncbi:hypothetical protein B0H13DRAFT_2370891 [Mycena leptocephala]|nr:hypothetical protein B0H13DRAFT_2370891 [Mycena leptocephala]
MTALDSSDEYNDEEFANLIASLDLGSLNLGNGPSSAATPPPRTPPRNRPTYSASAPRTLPSSNSRRLTPATTALYYYESPTRSGYTTQWSRAGSATQGVPGASVCVERATSSRRPKRRGRLKPKRKTASEANAAFQYAQARSWTRVVNSAVATPIPALPQPLGPDNDGANPLHGSDVLLDDRWFVVYCGICPGLNTVGIRGALHHSVVGKANALATYTSARRRGEVAVVLPSYQAHQNPPTPSDPFL